MTQEEWEAPTHTPFLAVWGDTEGQGACGVVAFRKEGYGKDLFPYSACAEMCFAPLAKILETMIARYPKRSDCNARARYELDHLIEARNHLVLANNSQEVKSGR